MPSPPSPRSAPRPPSSDYGGFVPSLQRRNRRNSKQIKQEKGVCRESAGSLFNLRSSVGAGHARPAASCQHSFMGYIVGEGFILPAGRRGRRPLQMGSYHFPLAIRPPTKMAEKMATKRKNVIHSGASTQNQDHEISPIAFSTTKIKVNATTGSNPGRSERLAFFIRRITSKC